MSYKDLSIKFSYETGVDDVVSDFYIPVLRRAKRYDRITGFFSSTSLALAARGIAGLIANEGTMRIICCPRLSPGDTKIIKESISNKTKVIEGCLISELLKVEDEFQKDHVAALGWMLERGFLQIKIALLSDDNGLLDAAQMEDSPIMHQKVGILYDTDYNGISFSGSNNESASGWLYNLEEFKVFKSWEPGQKDYYEADREKFESFWRNTHKNAEVVDLPEAVRQHLIKESSDFSIEKIALERYASKKCNNIVIPKKKEELRLFYYQKEAVDKWLSSNNQILLEMVTGSGKTRTAIGCLRELLLREERPLLTVIACPQTTLSNQWKDDIDRLDLNIEKSIVCDGTAPGWKINIANELLKLSNGLYDNLIVYTTHTTCCSKDFINLVSEIDDVAKFFIGDEVHGMGSSQHKKGLLNCYEYRVGCSATPSRWFDDYGTAVINNYFGNNKYEFTIEDALSKFNPVTNKHFLVSYYYHPCFISMTEDELYKYQSLTKKLSRLKKSEDLEKIREYILFQRADLEKNAENKYLELERILDKLQNDIADTIIFVSDEQIKRVVEILSNRGIMCHEFTKDQSPKASERFGGISERDFIIKKFKEKDYQVLVAIKCLDEGIDIPSAKRAIIMASSTNPREYIQRIGRVIRQAEGKTHADLYDMIIKPDFSGYKDEALEDIEKKIFKAELNRVDELNRNSMNNVDNAKVISKILGELL